MRDSTKQNLLVGTSTVVGGLLGFLDSASVTMPFLACLQNGIRKISPGDNKAIRVISGLMSGCMIGLALIQGAKFINKEALTKNAELEKDNRELKSSFYKTQKELQRLEQQRNAAEAQATRTRRENKELIKEITRLTTENERLQRERSRNLNPFASRPRQSAENRFIPENVSTISLGRSG